MKKKEKNKEKTSKKVLKKVVAILTGSIIKKMIDRRKND